MQSTRPEQPPPITSYTQGLPKARYKIMPVSIHGKIWSVGELIPYGNVAGFLREVVIESPGMYDKAYTPVTLFNETANSVGTENIGQEVKCEAYLSSRQFIDRNNNVRWALQVTGHRLDLVGLPDKKPTIPNADKETEDEFPF